MASQFENETGDMDLLAVAIAIAVSIALGLALQLGSLQLILWALRRWGH